MDSAALIAAPPSVDVLPTGVRRRWGRADALLPAVLAGELLAGVLLGLAWDLASTVPAGSAAPVSGYASTGAAVVVVPPAPVPGTTPAPPPPLRTEPRSPFAVQLG